MDPAIIGALVGAAVAGVLSSLTAYLSHRHAEKLLAQQHDFQHSQQRDQMLRAKGEELYATSEALSMGVFSAFFPLYMVMRGEISYNDFLNLHNKNAAMSTYDANRFEMLVDVYFPSTRGAYDQMQNALRAHNEVVTQHKCAYKDGNGPGEEFIRPFKEAQMAFENAGRAFSNEVLVEIKKIDVAQT